MHRRREADLIDPLQHDLADLLLRLVRLLPQREGDVVVEIHGAEQGAVLEEDPELAAHLEELGAAPVRDGLAVDEDVAVVGEHQADEVLDEHALAGARRAEDHGDHPVGDADVQAVQDAVAAERLVHVDALDRPEVTRGSLADLHRARVVGVIGGLVEQSALVLVEAARG